VAASAGGYIKHTSWSQFLHAVGVGILAALMALTAAGPVLRVINRALHQLDKELRTFRHEVRHFGRSDSDTGSGN